MNRLKIAIIGRGNVATHLHKALAPHADIRIVNPHTLEEMPGDADISIISVSDNAIREVAEKSSKYNCGILVHTSGSTDINVLDGCARHTGVFYPLQTFSRAVPLDYSHIPFFIEASSFDAEKTLMQLARQVSDKVFHASSERRRGLHIASVFACNFVNHLWSIADEVLYDLDLDINVLQPLIQETFRKAMDNPPGSVQTGPAVRGDGNTIRKHIEMLAGRPEIQELYKQLSISIYHNHNN